VFGRFADFIRLLKAIRAEKDLAGSLVSIGLTPKQAFQLLSDPVIGQKQTSEEAGEGVVDASDREEGGNVIIWWNNIEKDSR
jgi:UDP-glucose:glycoprotein glucosyltransferase